MASNVDYDYEDEESIDVNLKCSICNDPLTDPVSTLCHHSYCRPCLTTWLNNSRLTCPTCRQIISIASLIPITLLNFISMLDQIPVRCKLCDQGKIQRGNFGEHLDRRCPKKIFSCTSTSIGCSWTGVREELSNHLLTCTYEASKCAPEKPKDEDHSRVDAVVEAVAIQRRSVLRRQEFNEYAVFTCVDPNLDNVSGEEIAMEVRETICHGLCTNLNLSGHQISPQNILVIVSALSNSTSLTHLELGRCSLGDLSIRFLSPTLAMHRCLQCLDLYDNSITDAGVQYLASMLEINRSLIELKLSYNKISNRGVSILTNVLVNRNPQLECLSLLGNSLIDKSSIYSIFRIIRYNQSLKKLNLEYCNFSWCSQQSIKLYRIAQFRTDLEILL